MDHPTQTRLSSRDEPQRGASGVTRSASIPPDVHNRSPSSDSAFSRSDTHSNSAGAVIHNYHYHCCNHHGPNAQRTTAATASPAAPVAQPSASSSSQPEPSGPQEVVPAPAAGFDVYQPAPQPPQPERLSSTRLDNLERTVDHLQHHLSSAFYRIAEVRVENRRLRRHLDQSTARQAGRSPQRHPYLPVASRPAVAHRGRPANARISPPHPLRNSPTRPSNGPPLHRRDNSSPHSSPSASIRRGAASPAHHSPAVRGCRCANCAPRNRSVTRQLPSPPVVIPQGLSPFFRGYAEGGIHNRRSASSPNVSPSRRASLSRSRPPRSPRRDPSLWEPIQILSPIRRHRRADSPSDTARGPRLRFAIVPQGAETSPAVRQQQLNDNTTATSAQAVRDSASESESVPSLEEPPPSRSQSPLLPPQPLAQPNSPPTHPHSPDGGHGGNPAVSPTPATPAPAPFTRPYSDVAPAPTLAENVGTTQRQLRAFFLDEIRLVREIHASATPLQLWVHFVADIVASGIFLTPAEIRASWHFAFGQPSNQVFDAFCTMNMASLLSRLAQEADRQ